MILDAKYSAGATFLLFSGFFYIGRFSFFSVYTVISIRCILVNGVPVYIIDLSVACDLLVIYI